MYRLKQALRQWSLKLTDALVEAGYAQSPYDHSLFTKKEGIEVVVVLIYVDDLLIISNISKLIQDTKEALHIKFSMKDLGDHKYFLRIEIVRSKTGILLNQRKYALELISESGLSGSKPAATPLEPNKKFTIVEYDELTGNRDDVIYKDVTVYQRLIGRLLYLTTTKPDISFAVQLFSQFMQKPKVSHWEAGLRLVRYIKGCPGQVILLSSTPSTQLEAFCDSD